jgi:hypothetical protein
MVGMPIEAGSDRLREMREYALHNLDMIGKQIVEIFAIDSQSNGVFFRDRGDSARFAIEDRERIEGFALTDNDLISCALFFQPHFAIHDAIERIARLIFIKDYVAFFESRFMADGRDIEQLIGLALREEHRLLQAPHLF